MARVGDGFSPEYTYRVPYARAAGGPDADRHRLDQDGAEGVAGEALDGSPVPRR